MAASLMNACSHYFKQTIRPKEGFLRGGSFILRGIKRFIPAWQYNAYYYQRKLLSASSSHGNGEGNSEVGQHDEGTNLGSEIEITELDSEISEDGLKTPNIQERILIMQPDFKWGKGRFLTKNVEHRVEEAEALVHSVSNWKVLEKQIESLHDLNSKHFFGSGKLKELQNKVAQLKETNDLTAVFINTSKLSKKQTNILEDAFNCHVYDRYRIVLEIFKERAKTKEAKLQVKLAELQYKKWHLTSDSGSFDQQRGGTMTVGGSGETHLEMKKRLIAEKEAKIRKELHHIENQRFQNRAERVNKHVPQIALIGYTNAGKTTLAKALSGDLKLEPEDRLFATLDTTAHRGKLPCGISLVYIDTVGFITDLPHELIKSFSTTLKDVKNATLLVHVRDMTHPEKDLQKKSVLNVLENLNVETKLMDNMIEVHNKVDKRNDVQIVEAKDNENGSTIPVSALKQTGIEDLKFLLESKIFDVTGRRVFSLRINQQGSHLSWLHQHATILNTAVVEGDKLEVQAIMDSSTYAKWQRLLKKK